MHDVTQPGQKRIMIWYIEDAYRSLSLSVSLGRAGERCMPCPGAPFMPAPSPRPSSRAAARFGALCPRATDSEAFTEAGLLLASSMPRRSAPPCKGCRGSYVV